MKVKGSLKTLYFAKQSNQCSIWDVSLLSCLSQLQTGPHMTPVSISRQHDKPGTRLLHLSTKPGAEVAQSNSGDEKDLCKCPCSSIILSHKENRLQHIKSTLWPLAGQTETENSRWTWTWGYTSQILTTNLRPEIVLWSPSLLMVYIIELTVPWEDAVEGAHKRRSLKITMGALAMISYRGFVVKSTT